MDNLRIALRFSLWTWAAYWPGGGLVLAVGGLDLVSLAFGATALALFFLIMSSGALRPTASRTLRQFALERPIYIVGAVVLLVTGSVFVGPLANAGLLLFALAYVGGMVFVMWRAVQLAAARAEPGQGMLRALFSTRVDQVIGTTLLVGAFALLVLGDAWLSAIGNGQLGTSAPVVAAGSWINLGYPVLLLVATRPFRERLTLPAFRLRSPLVPAVPSGPAPTPPQAK